MGICHPQLVLLVFHVFWFHFLLFQVYIVPHIHFLVILRKIHLGLSLPCLLVFYWCLVVSLQLFALDISFELFSNTLMQAVHNAQSRCRPYLQSQFTDDLNLLSTCCHQSMSHAKSRYNLSDTHLLWCFVVVVLFESIPVYLILWMRIEILLIVQH